MNDAGSDKKDLSALSSGVEALEVLEAARDTKWASPSFAAQLFLGRLKTPLIFPFATQSEEDRKVGDQFLQKLETFLKANVDPDAIDREGEVPAEVIRGLAELGCFGMKIPKEYGGLGLSQTNYNRVIVLIGSYCGSTSVWLSAHQSIGVPQPLKMFGTDAQKKKYLPRLAKGAVSAFALTEPDVGSDPAKMATTATPVDDGAAYLINGEKLWCTNGPDADVMVVMARTPDRVIRGKSRKQITALIVERGMPGVETAHHCRFMGIRGISNGLLRFTNVRVPKENIIWGLGRGLKLALMTLNTGRLTLPAGCVGAGKRCLQIAREWVNERNQWGKPIGQHEAIADKIGWIASHLFAMESVVELVSAWADRGDIDIRIEAAMAKLFGSEVVCKIADETLQIRGGRGYETADSLKERGEKPIAMERIYRDLRINRIIEGTSEIMHLFLAREALDPHLQIAFDMILPKTALPKRMKAAVQAAGFYSLWYPSLWLPRFSASPVGLPGKLKGHWTFVGRKSQVLARCLFHQMARHQQKLEKHQMILARVVDVGVDLFAMSTTLSRAASLAEQEGTQNAVELADLFCAYAKRRIRRTLSHLRLPEDAKGYEVSQEVLKGSYPWLEEGMVR